MVDLTHLLDTPDEEIPPTLVALAGVSMALAARLTPDKPATTPDAYMTAGEVADLLGVTESWVRKHSADLSPIRVSQRMVRYRRSDVDGYLTRMARKGT